MPENTNNLAYHFLMLVSLPASFFFLSAELFVFSLVVGYLIAVVGLLVGLHRYFSHQSFKTNSFFHYVLVFTSTIITNGSILMWSNVHEIHHNFSDTENDPHSPKYMSRFKVYFKSWFNWGWTFFDSKKLQQLREQVGLEFSHKYYLYIISLWIIFILLVNPLLIWALYFFPVFISLNISSFVNTFTHDKEGNPINNRWYSILTCGDGGCHKDHHDRPWAVSHKFPDLTGYIIRLIEK